MALQDDINNFSCSNTAIDLVLLAAQTASVTSNRIVSVASVADLPDLTNNTVDPGTVLFVESIQVPVVAQIGCWTGLDNRVLRTDFQVSVALAWGRNNCSQLGDNTTVDRSSPVSVVGGFTDWCRVSAGRCHSLGIRTNGSAWAWGFNGNGRLGDNTTVGRSSPVSVVGGFTNWCGVSAGYTHSLGIRTNGTIWSWGCNSFGQVGDGTITSRTSPVSVVGGFTDWCGVSAGSQHSLGVRCNGSAWAWGRNTYSQLGLGDTTHRSSPVSVVGGFTDWCEVAGGAYHSLGIRTNGTVWAWGNNSQGRLGDGTNTARSSPVSVVGGFTDWCEVAAGNHSLGIRTNGTVWAWGYNGQGRLGDGTTIGRSSPVSVVGGFTDWCGVSAGNNHSIGIRTNGTVWAWGFNNAGRLGDGTTTDRSSPVQVVGGFTDWCGVAAGSGYHSLAIRTP
jgi:YD repeat-containing protein